MAHSAGRKAHGADEVVAHSAGREAHSASEVMAHSAGKEAHSADKEVHEADVVTDNVVEAAGPKEDDMTRQLPLHTSPGSGPKAPLPM